MARRRRSGGLLGITGRTGPGATRRNDPWTLLFAIVAIRFVALLAIVGAAAALFGDEPARASRPTAREPDPRSRPRAPGYPPGASGTLISTTSAPVTLIRSTGARCTLTPRAPPPIATTRVPVDRRVEDHRPRPQRPERRDRPALVARDRRGLVRVGQRQPAWCPGGRAASASRSAGRRAPARTRSRRVARRTRIERSSAPSSMPWNAALSSASRAISVRTTRNGTPDGSSASIAGSWAGRRLRHAISVRSRHDRSDATATPIPSHRRARPDADDRPRPSRRRDDRDRRHDGHRGPRRPARGARRPAPAARWARSSCPRWTRPRTTAAWARSGRASSSGAMGGARRDRVGEPRLQGLGHDGPGREPRRPVLLAGGHRRGDRAARLPRADVPAGRHDDLQRVRRLRPPRPHPDPPRRRRRLRARGRSRRGTRSSWRPSTAGRARRGRGRAGAVDAGQALRAGDPGLGAHGAGGADGGDRRAVVLVRRRRTRRPSRSRSSRRTSRRCSCPTNRSRPGSTCRPLLDQRWAAIQRARTQIADDNPFIRFGRDAWQEFWSREAFIRRESRVPAPDAETDLFAGLDGLEPGPTGWGQGAAQPAAIGAP